MPGYEQRRGLRALQTMTQTTHDDTQGRLASQGLASDAERETRANGEPDLDRFHALLVATSDVVYRLNPDCTELRFLAGKDFVPDKTDPGTSWWDRYIPKDEQPRLRAAMEEAMHRGGLFEMEHRILRADGVVCWTSSRAVPIKDATGKVLEWLGTASDITARKNREQGLLDADRHKNEFLAILAHELRNPLAPMVSAMEIMRPWNAEPLHAKAHAILDRQMGVLRRLVDDLMDLARIRAGQLQLRKERVSLQSILENAAETVRPLMEQRRQRFSMQLPAAVMLDADRTRLQQVFINLIGNAAKYTEDGGLIGVRVVAEQGVVEVVVQDTGIGIEPDLVPQLFDLYTQSGRSLAKSGGGLGLGLAIAARLVAAHGGTIEARAAVGAGSEFIVRIPHDTQSS